MRKLTVPIGSKDTKMYSDGELNILNDRAHRSASARPRIGSSRTGREGSRRRPGRRRFKVGDHVADRFSGKYIGVVLEDKGYPEDQHPYVVSVVDDSYPSYFNADELRAVLEPRRAVKNSHLVATRALYHFSPVGVEWYGVQELCSRGSRTCEYTRLEIIEDRLVRALDARAQLIEDKEWERTYP